MVGHSNSNGFNYDWFHCHSSSNRSELRLSFVVLGLGIMICTTVIHVPLFFHHISQLQALVQFFVFLHLYSVVYCNVNVH